MDEKISILHADDEPIARHVARRALESAGYAVTQVKSGQEAIAAATENHPDLVLLDCRMPDIDGLEVVEILRANDATRDIPIVVVSALQGATHVDEALAKGVSSCVSKPYEPRTLLREVRKALRSGDVVNDLRRR